MGMASSHGKKCTISLSHNRKCRFNQEVRPLTSSSSTSTPTEMDT